MLAEDLDQRVVQLHLLQLGDEVLLVAAHFLLGIQAFGHDPLLPQAHESRFHGQRQVGLSLLQETARRGERVRVAVLPGARRACWWKRQGFLATL